MELKVRNSVIALLILSGASVQAFGQDVRIKDLANIRGVRSNQLTGFGLIIGLSNTGDSSGFLTRNQAAANMLTRLGMKTDAGQIQSQSMAAVIATADLPAFSRIGDRLDIKVSIIGDAKSLAGGTLLMTPLKAADGSIYVVAQGAVVVGQAKGAGPQVLTAALVPNGGVIEKEFMPNIAPKGVLTLSLKRQDFTTSARVAERINMQFKGFYAKSLDPVSIEVEIPPMYLDRVTDFVSELEGLQVTVDQKAIVVLNERTGTVVMGADVVISKVAIAHGELSIRVGEGSDKDKKSPNQKVVNIGGATVGSLVESMNALGVKPADLVGILQAVHASGAMQAELRFL